jgi:hypothetical protein
MGDEIAKRGGKQTGMRVGFIGFGLYERNRKLKTE